MREQAPDPVKLWLGAALFALLGGVAVWAGLRAWLEGIEQIERGAPWLGIRRISFFLPGGGLALLVLTPISAAAALGRPLARAAVIRAWILFAAALILGAVGGWQGANVMRSRAAQAGYTICQDIQTYGLRENGRYWALRPELCPPPDAAIESRGEASRRFGAGVIEAEQD